MLQTNLSAMRKHKVLFILTCLFHASFAQQTAPCKLDISLNPIDAFSIENDGFNMDTFKFQLPVNISVLAAGESTHGTREFFTSKVNLFKYLVKNHGFRVFLLEAGYGECLVINEYIHSDYQVDIPALVKSMGYWVWSEQSFVDLIVYMREYNKEHPNDPLYFMGFDMQRTANSYKALSEALPEIDSSFIEELSSFAWLSENRSARKAGKRKYNACIRLLSEWQRRLENPNAQKNDEMMLYHLEVLIQFCKLEKEKYGFALRDEFMAKNIIALQKILFNKRCFVWAHNMHISKKRSQKVVMGNILEKELGNNYYALALDFGQGKFNYNSGKMITHSPLITGTGVFQTCLMSFPFSSFLVDLNESGGSKHLRVIMHDTGANFYKEEILQTVDLYEEYDGLLFIKSTTPSCLLK